MYEVFCSKGKDQFNIFDANGAPLTAYGAHGNKISKHKNSRVVFGAFLDLEKVQGICSGHGLKFADRWEIFFFF